MSSSGELGGDILTTLYDELLASSVVRSDQDTVTNLHTFRPRHEALWRALGHHLNGRRETIADIGCHNGFFLRLVEPLGFRRFVAIDYFELPPERSFLPHLNGVEFIKANFNEEDFLGSLADGSVDAAVSTEVFEHIYGHPAGYLAEVWRVLRPGGLLLFSTPNPGYLSKVLKSLAGKPVLWGDLDFARTPKTNTGTGKPLAVWDIHFREYQPTDMRTLLEELKGAEVILSGFAANAPRPDDSFLGGRAKRMLQVTGAARTRIFASTQYYVVRKTGA